MTVALLISGVLLLVAIALNIVGTVTNEWLTYTQSNISTSEGLWRFCLDDSCESLSDSESIDAVRAMMVMGIIFGSVALIMCVLEFGYSSFQEKYNTKLVVLALGFVIAADVFTMIGVAVYAAEYREDREDEISGIDEGYSFWLSVSAVLVYAIAAVSLFVAFILHVKKKKLARKDDKLDVMDREFRKRQLDPHSHGMGLPLPPEYLDRSRSFSRRRDDRGRKSHRSEHFKRSRSDRYDRDQYVDTHYSYPGYHLAGYMMPPGPYRNRPYAMAPPVPNRAYALTGAQGGMMGVPNPGYPRGSDYYNSPADPYRTHHI